MQPVPDCPGGPVNFPASFPETRPKQGEGLKSAGLRQRPPGGAVQIPGKPAYKAKNKDATATYQLGFAVAIDV